MGAAPISSLLALYHPLPQTRCYPATKMETRSCLAHNTLHATMPASWKARGERPPSVFTMVKSSTTNYTEGPSSLLSSSWLNPITWPVALSALHILASMSCHLGRLQPLSRGGSCSGKYLRTIPSSEGAAPNSWGSSGVPNTWTWATLQERAPNFG